MIFTTAQFVLFFLLFYSAYVHLRGTPRRVLLLVASYAFYGSWNARFLLLIIGSTLLDFHVARRIGRSDDSDQRRQLLLLSICGNLGALALFKYYNFFVDSAAHLLALFGLSVSPLVLDVVLPVGISFYTFQTLSYTIDVYRGKLPPTESLLDFALYVAFFPQLVAGPIERATHLLPQLRQLDRRLLSSGWGLVALGAFKKVVIADHMAPLVAATFSIPQDVHGPALWVGTYAFALQIYGDFSGYSDIAVGLGRLMGIEIVQNFRSPYAADDPSDFWQRWHISLSSWLRDYLYIPLGGNRGGALRTTGNLTLTMLLGGLWHGAAWNYVLWGAYHGLLLVAFRPRAMRRLTGSDGPLPWVILRRLIFFHLVCLGWVLFRAESLADCGALWARMLSWDLSLSAWLEAVDVSGEGRYLAFMLAVMAIMVAVQNLRSDSQQLVDWFWPRACAPLRALVLLLLFGSTILLASEAPPPFIYFQF